ncbi:proline/glycine betaine ABC transporter permease [Clostridium sp. E02]|uniref:ABC transporter permease n=1 Tax=Clostridium sp. E02 TaxID=2487134 RepID=UPI000F53CFA9|nr:proline/glycine betaine ABC transporter permease [Clostridium sp. E02]
MIRLPIGLYVEKGVDWLTNNLSGFFGGIKTAIEAVINGFQFVYIGIPFVIMLILIGVLAYFTAGRKTAIFSIVGCLVIKSIELWELTMKTFALVTTATLIALLIGIPLGIWMSRSDRLNKVMRPILDFMQTMPAFVYLIPAVYFFDLGPVPGAFATIIFAMPPIVRLTSLGIRQVPADVVEASRSFGATPQQMLFKVQIPLAMPTILAGLNQTIMLSLSMVVISAMIGSGGLGDVVLKGISQMKIGEGFEGGLAVVILAMILDRVTQSVGRSKKTKTGSK